MQQNEKCQRQNDLECAHQKRGAARVGDVDARYAVHLRSFSDMA